MKFQYSVPAIADGSPLLDSRGKMVKRPILELELINKKLEKIQVLGIIDSGADTTTLNIQYADFLGVKLDRTRPKEIIGVGSGKVSVYQSVFPFEIKEMGIKLEVPAWYVDSQNVDILLGEEVFFETFRIKFEKDHDTFEINAVKK